MWLHLSATTFVFIPASDEGAQTSKCSDKISTCGVSMLIPVGLPPVTQVQHLHLCKLVDKQHMSNRKGDSLKE